MNRWPIVPLENFVAKKSGSVDPAKFPDEVFDLYSIPAFDAGQPDVRAGSEIGSAKQVVQPNDVLLSRIVPHIRRAWVVGESRSRRLIASGEWIVFRSPQVRPRYLRYFLVGDPFHAQFMRTVSGVGGSLLRAKATEVAKIKIPVPSLEEQEWIVKLLDEADELRKLRAQADRCTAALIPSLFHDMFGDPEHTRFSVKPLIELVAEERPITYGILKPGPDVEGGIPYVRVLDIKQSRLHVEQLHKTTKEIATQYRRSMLRPGDILVTIRGTVGRTCIVPDELMGANITQDTARLATIPSIEPVYVVEFLNTPWAQGWMNHHTQGQAVKGINLA